MTRNKFSEAIKSVLEHINTLIMMVLAVVILKINYMYGS